MRGRIYYIYVYVVRESKTYINMSRVRAFAPATVANMGCGFDVMGMTLDGVGDIVSVEVLDGDGLEIENISGIELPDDIEKNVITPAVRALMAAYGEKRLVKVVVERKISPGSGIGSSAASSAAAVYALNEALGRPFSDERLVEFAMVLKICIGKMLVLILAQFPVL